MWDPPRPGLEPASPAQAGRLPSTAPPGKPHNHYFLKHCMVFKELFGILSHLFFTELYEAWAGEFFSPFWRSGNSLRLRDVANVISWYNKKYIFGLCPSVADTELLKLYTSWVIRVRQAFFAIYNKPLSTTSQFMLMRWLLIGPWIASGWRLVARGTNLVIRGLEFSVPPSWPPGKGEALEIELIFTGQWFNQSCLCKGTSIKTLNDRSWRASGLENIYTCQEVSNHKLHRDRSSHTQDPSRPHPMYLFKWLFLCILYNILCNKLVIVS